MHNYTSIGYKECFNNLNTKPLILQCSIYPVIDIGLDDSIGPYVQFFINNNVTGQGLLNMTTEDLNKLRVEKIGHQV